MERCTTNQLHFLLSNLFVLNFMSTSFYTLLVQLPMAKKVSGFF